MVDTVLDTGESTESVRLSPRLPLSLTTATVDRVATVVDTEDMVDTVLDTGESTESVRLSPRLTLSLTTATVDTVATMEATEVTVMATASNMLLGSSDDFFFAQP